MRGLWEAGQPGLDRHPPTRPLEALAPSVSSGHTLLRAESRDVHDPGTESRAWGLLQRGLLPVPPS